LQFVGLTRLPPADILDEISENYKTDRQAELQYLRDYIDEEPESMLFIHGPKSSGKTTLLYKFFEQMEKEQKPDVKFMDLRESFTNVYEDFLKTFSRVETH
jgi:AAA+ ATPase superfamily predicted ATPase